MAIRVLIIDDEPLTRRQIRRLLSDSADIEIIGECGDGQAAVAAIAGGRPDLVFLDVQMPELSGLDVIRSIGSDAMPVTIFVTAHDRYAVPAFDANAADYLLKPFGRERFARALGRARESLIRRLAIRASRRGERSEGTDQQPTERLPVVDGGRIVFVPIHDIAWIAVRGNYVRVYTTQRMFSVRTTLTHLERKLDSHQFVRIHRSTIVNARRIREIQPWLNGHHVVVLDNGQRLRMSRYQRQAAKQLGL